MKNSDSRTKIPIKKDKMKLNRIIISAALFMAPAILAGAQETATETAALPFLNYSGDTRSLAMGGLTVTGEPGAYAHFNNMAAVPFSENTISAGVSYGMMQPTAVKGNLFSLGAAWNIKDRFGVTLGVLAQTGEKYDLTNEAGVPDGTFAPKDFRIGAGFSYRIIDGLSVGVGLNYAQSTLAPKSDLYKTTMSTFAADIQVMYRIKGFNISLSASNLGVPVESASGAKFDLPMNAKLAAGWANDFERHHVAAGVEGGVFFGGPAAGFAGAGAEYMYNDLVAVRAGYHYAGKSNGLASFASVGLGFRFFGVNIDAAYLIGAGDSPMKNSFSVGVGYSF